MFALQTRIRPADVVLDIGPGIRPQRLIKPKAHLCIEPFLPYIEKCRELYPKRSELIFLNATWQSVVSILPDKSVDTVIAFDVIEHLEREDGLKLMEQCKRVARQQAVFFTPYGFVEQSYEESELDRWGMQGGYWQTHRSGWKPDDFGEDWEFIVCPEFHSVDDEGKPLAKPYGAMWAIWPYAGTHVSVLASWSNMLRSKIAGRL